MLSDRAPAMVAASTASLTIPRRLPGLDSLRGMASLSVVFGHCLHLVLYSSYYPAYAAIIFFMNLPMLKTLVNLNDAVLLFFMHSGYVLALPFIARRANSYPAFAVKRVFRIYPAHLVVIALLLGGIALWHPQAMPGMGDWFNRKATVQPHLHDVAQQGALMFMNPDKDPLPFNGVVWSLVHEMRVSLLFPLICVLLLRRTPWAQFLLLLCYPVLFHYMAPHATRLDHLLPGTVATFGYVYLFLIGIVLAEHREAIARAWARLPRWGSYAVLLLSVLGYSAHLHVFPTSPLFPADPILILALVLLVIAAANGEAVFLTRPVRWLGKVSYSLYLVHIPLLLLWTRLLYPHVPFWGVWLLTIVTALGTSALLYQWVEYPLQQFGRALAARMDAGKALS